MTATNLLGGAIGINLLSCIRALHFACGIILAAVGTIALYVSVLANAELSSALTLMNHYQNLNTEIFLGCSILLIFIAFVNVFASFNASPYALISAAVSVLLFFIGTISYTTYAGITTDYSKTGNLYKQLHWEVRHYSRHERYVKDLQTTLSCCGANGYKDYTNIPQSCCHGDDKCGVDNPQLKTNGCFESLQVVMGYYAVIIFVSLAFLAIIEIISVGLSIILCHTQWKLERAPILSEESTIKIPRVQTPSPEVEVVDESPAPEVLEVVMEEPTNEEEAKLQEEKAETQKLGGIEFHVKSPQH